MVCEQIMKFCTIFSNVALLIKAFLFTETRCGALARAAKASAMPCRHVYPRLCGKIPEDSFKIISDCNKLDTLVAIQAYSDFNEIEAGISGRKGQINVGTRSMSLWAGQAGFSCQLYVGLGDEALQS